MFFSVKSMRACNMTKSFPETNLSSDEHMQSFKHMKGIFNYITFFDLATNERLQGLQFKQNGTRRVGLYIRIVYTKKLVSIIYVNYRNIKTHPS